ncbi:MAG: helix-turn-helix domain-containing protein [Actinomycetota bacterium]|nr:helix-turn-helix domain-containing protein [Actinomycetota bacterium]
MGTRCFDAGDVVGRRRAAGQLVGTRAATPAHVARSFGVDFETVRRLRRLWNERGGEALRPTPGGPDGPRKLTDEVLSQVEALRLQGLGLPAMARGVGLDPSTVRRALEVLETKTPGPSTTTSPAALGAPQTRPAPGAHRRARPSGQRRRLRPRRR